MNHDSNLTADSFELLLEWLDPNREAAGEKYEKVRVRLIKIFNCRGCGESDSLADETINRVLARVGEIRKNYSGDPALYFYGVAQKVHLEYLRKRPPIQESALAGALSTSQSAPVKDDEIEEEYACLEECMDRLPSNNRRLVLEYYQLDKRAKIEHRKALAEQLGIGVNALRIRAHRIRLQLQACVEQCVEQSPAH
jgi:DNA-directed RNA polymerase specialized sigma24 family protein